MEGPDNLVGMIFLVLFFLLIIWTLITIVQCYRRVGFVNFLGRTIITLSLFLALYFLCVGAFGLNNSYDGEDAKYVLIVALTLLTSNIVYGVRDVSFATGTRMKGFMMNKLVSLIAAVVSAVVLQLIFQDPSMSIGGSGLVSIFTVIIGNNA